MLERKYDPTLPYCFARYGRMSGDRQNKRSPDQQFATIDETLLRCGYPWQCNATYRDDAISGRYVRKRRGLQRMLCDIEAGLIRIDAIVVDTLERLGRAEEIAELRRKLFIEFGVIVVAADNNFADPTGVVGKAVGMVEQIRSTENTRVSRHNVLRGKKDAARLRRWPGGPPPFGFKLKSVVNDTISPPDVYNTLEPEPREAAALQLAFQRAAETGEGNLRLSRWWNESPDIPADFKPISPFTMGYRLNNRVAIGELVWGANCTDVVNDSRVIEANPDGAEVVPHFCSPLINMDLFERVQRLREARSQQIRERRKREASDDAPPKLIAPQARGLTLKYLLTGLVRCARCNASMRSVPSGRRSKEGKRYIYYTCPRHYDGACPNGRHLPEEQLRTAVIARLRARLFPPPKALDQTPAWLPELTDLVRRELRRYREEEPDRLAAVEQELRQLEQQLAGWTMTLGNPQLPTSVRIDIEARFAQAKQIQQELQERVAAEKAMQRHLDLMLDPKEVIEQLRRLGEILAGHNPTLGNLELSKHIDRIDCFADGRVVMRGTLLGLFEGAVELLTRDGPPLPAPAPQQTGEFPPVKPRRRARLRLPSLSAESQDRLGHIDTALDPERLAGLPQEFLWTESLVIEEKQSWAQEHAEEVARLRSSGMTMERLAEHFGKTVPTIRKALRLAAESNEAFRSLPRKLPRACWAKDHAAEVARLKAEGLSVPQIARRVGKSEPTIRAALEHAEGLANKHVATPPLQGEQGNGSASAGAEGNQSASPPSADDPSHNA
jgi:DNA invertase Pin-like site-specific DNA recombinase/DNA-binding CsgD family transcriptional regulator